MARGLVPVDRVKHTPRGNQEKPKTDHGFPRQPGKSPDLWERTQGLRGLPPVSRPAPLAARDRLLPVGIGVAVFLVVELEKAVVR